MILNIFKTYPWEVLTGALFVPVLILWIFLSIILVDSIVTGMIGLFHKWRSK